MIGRFSRQVGIGAARQVGAQMTDWIGRLVSIVPEATSEFLDWSGSMVDLSDATGIATKDLMLFNQALAEAGFEGDATKSILTFAEAMREAKTQGGDMAELFQRLGVSLADLDKGPMELIKQIGPALSAINDVGERSTFAKMLFGGQGGTKFMAFLKDPIAAMKAVEEGIGGMADSLNPLLRDADALGDTLSRFAYLRRYLIGSVLQGAGFTNLQTMTDSLLSLGQTLKPIAVWIGQAIRPMIEFLNKVVRDIGRMGFGDFAKEALQSPMQAIGRMIGDGIKESFDVKSGIKSLFSFGNKSTSSIDPRLLQETTEQTDLLQRIYAKNPTAMFA